MEQIDLEIGVIYTHERGFMPRLLETMSMSGTGLRMRLLLVDNASLDGAEQWKLHFSGETHLLRNNKRLSYAENLNNILQASTARHVLLMNTDMYFNPAERCLHRMVDFLDQHPQCGVAGCRLFHGDGADAYAARRFQTPSLIIARRLGLSPLMRNTIQRHFYAEHTPEQTWECDWLSGCFLMVRRKAALEVGGFDESYGKYFEDVDFCLRMARAGWQVMHHGAASCFHLEQRKSKKLLSLDAWKHLVAYSRWIRRWGFVPSPAPPAEPRRRAA